MTTGRILLYIPLAIFLFYAIRGLGAMPGDPSEPIFKLYGDEQLISECIINVRSIRDEPYPSLYTESRTQTLLYKGRRYPIENNGDISAYSIYFSCGKQVGELSFENIFRPLNGEKERINEIHIISNEKGICLKHFALTFDVGKKEGFESNIGVSPEKFFTWFPDMTTEEKSELQARFYAFYGSAEQDFKRDPIKREVVKYFKELPLNQKKSYGVLPEDLQKMGLPENELLEMLEHYQAYDAIKPGY